MYDVRSAIAESIRDLGCLVCGCAAIGCVGRPETVLRKHISPFQVTGEEEVKRAGVNIGTSENDSCCPPSGLSVKPRCPRLAPLQNLCVSCWRAFILLSARRSITTMRQLETLDMISATAASTTSQKVMVTYSILLVLTLYCNTRRVAAMAMLKIDSDLKEALMMLWERVKFAI
jgi:hypothetical protein